MSHGRATFVTSFVPCPCLGERVMARHVLEYLNTAAICGKESKTKAVRKATSQDHTWATSSRSESCTKPYTTPSNAQEPGVSETRSLVSFMNAKGRRAPGSPQTSVTSKSFMKKNRSPSDGSLASPLSPDQHPPA